MSTEEISQGGQAEVAPDPQGQPETTATQTEQAPQSTQSQAPEESFTDFNSLPDEVRAQLEPWYKRMQGDYTRKTQRLSKQEKEWQQKVQAYDQFSSAPIPNLQQLAQQYGYQMVPMNPQAQQQQQQRGVSEDWTPNTWEEVFSKSTEYLAPKIQEMLSPYQQKIQALEAELGQQRASKIEQQFNAIDPNWRQYEDDMRDLLQEHPSLAKDPVKLYKLVVPDEVFKAKATQEAIKLLEAKTKSAQIESSGRSKPSHAKTEGGPISFDEAFRRAKASLGR